MSLSSSFYDHVQDGLVAGVVRSHNGELIAEAGDIELLLEGHTRLVLHVEFAHDGAGGAFKQHGGHVGVVLELQRQVVPAVLGGEAGLDVVGVEDPGLLGIQGHVEDDAVVHGVVAVVQIGVHPEGDLGAIGSALPSLSLPSHRSFCSR